MISVSFELKTITYISRSEFLIIANSLIIVYDFGRAQFYIYFAPVD